jgi:eukaryotic-like serine/threonine-protein kinase
MGSGSVKRILPPGTRIAGYLIEAEVGQGAMAVVYRARQLNLDRPVALKILADELAANQEFVRRFFNEARAAAALSHAHIVQAYDAGVAEGGIPFFAMEYVEGETLLQRIRRQGYVRPGPGIEVALDIADALNYGWQRQGLTHGDIKPENIMINQAGETKLADFGLAKVAGHDFSGSDILLTPLYAPPEMIRGERRGKGDCRSDIYAFGATLYHLFGGSPPFPGEKAQEVMQRHLTETLEPLRQRNPAVPRRISDLVEVLLRKAPAERPGDWEAVLRSLRDIRKALTEPPGAAVVTAPATHLKLTAGAVRSAHAAVFPVRRRHAPWWVAAAILLFVAGVAGLAVVRHGQSAGSAAASPAAAPGEPPPAPDPAGGGNSVASWDEVQRQVLAERDPERALALLERFAEHRAAQDLPAAYGNLLAEQRAAVARHQGTPPPTGGAEAAGSASLPPLKAPGTSPPGPAVAGLDAKGRTEPPADTEGPPASAAAADETPAGSPAVPSTDVPVTPGDRPADAFVAYMGKLAGLECRFPLHLEEPMKDGQDWLLSFTADSAEGATVAFVVNTALPALEEALPKLVANAAALAGMKLPGRQYSACTVATLDMEGIALREQTRYGVVARKLAWQRLDGAPALILYLSQRTAGRAPSWSDRRPYLALALFSRNGKLYEDAVKSLPDAPEKADWDRLQTLLSRGAGEAKALRAWQRALEARRAGEWTAAYGLLLELQATRTAVAERYGERARKLAAELSAGVPGVAGGRLVREGASLLDTDANGALVRLLLAGNRYGAADFPERSGLDDLRRRAVAALPLEEWQRQQAQRQPQQIIVPFARGAAPGIPSLAARLHQAAAGSNAGDKPEPNSPLSTLEGPALLELGDWAGAERLLSKLRDSAMAALPPAARAATWFSRGLIESRSGVVKERAIAEELCRCSRELTDKADSEFVLLPQVLALEYGIFLRGGEADLQPYLAQAGPLTPRGPTPNLRSRLILNLATLGLDRGQTEAATRLLVPVFGTPEAPAQWGLSAGELTLLRLATAPSAEPRALLSALAELDAKGSTEWDLRLVASMALARAPLDEGVWRILNEWISLQGMSFGPVGGTAVYDLAVARTGQCLAGGDLKGAAATAAWALALAYPCMAPYYARLTFCRWGVARLQGVAGQHELAEQVEAASSANRQEKALSRLFLSEAQRGKAREVVAGNTEGKFWFEWLMATERLGSAAAKDGRRGPERLTASGLPRAERVLAAGLVAWSAGASPAAAGQERAQPPP